VTDLTLGALHLGGSTTRFRVWAPSAGRVEVHLTGPAERFEPLSADRDGYWQADLQGVGPGAGYFIRLDGQKEFPDPASRFQPQGVHGPSAVVAGDFAWTDSDWQAPPINEYVIYELHTGAFTQQGTFDAILPHLPYLKDLGITAIELMPVAQFPGGRNWGYDGVLPFAAQNSYGGPKGLRRLVDGCHREGFAVLLDVVYNHLGPEGNYLREFGPYFTDKYQTPWGAALNYDGPGSNEVRRYFIESALYWARDCHVDGFRLDAVHAIVDPTAYPFLEEFTDALHAEAAATGRRIQVIAESSLNDPRLVRAKEHGGFAMDGFWNDDFHHTIHAVLTGEKTGYYADFGAVDQLEKALREGLVFTGEHSLFRGRRHGRPAEYVPAQRFVVSIQNHDQVGNRLLGERLSQIVPFEALKLAAGLLILSPFVPLLFMGEEYAETAPFQYFVSHSDPDLIEAVRKGRRAEFASFAWQGEAPDPQDEATFESSKIDLGRAAEGHHHALLRHYRRLLRLRKRNPALAELRFESQEVERPSENVIVCRRRDGDTEAAVFFNLGGEAADVPFAPGLNRWRRRVDSADERSLGPGSLVPEVVSPKTTSVRMQPLSLLVLERASDS
jgi:maltooligosyltrehalose trehalohydrolase